MPKRNFKPRQEQQPLVDEFTDLVILIKGSAVWSPEERKRYENLVRRIEAVS